jgi:class 3 adenylate cyclase/tetratricopeptide (TPR) repeat protein
MAEIRRLPAVDEERYPRASAAPSSVMRCPACSYENRAGARFCGECAKPLGVVVNCASCGVANSAEQKFCDACGRALRAQSAPAREPRSYTPAHLADKILTSRSAMEGERKHVTVLFADVQGSMDLAERVDAEEWHRILDRFFAILADGIHRFEGTINQFTGDGVMALFGAPIAHEDHAHRACYAALALGEELARYSTELRRTRGLGFSVRMGLNSGEVVVGKIGDDLRMDYTAQGRTVGLAARVQQLAAPDRAYLTESNAQLVGGYFALRALGEFAIKGVREPVNVYELGGVGSMRTRLDVSRARGFSRFVGRDAESRAVDDALQAALAGEGNVIALCAEAGVGKSRLALEFATRCRARGLAVYEAHGVAHGKTVPLLPTLDLLRSYFGITDRDGPAEARRKVAGTLVLLDPRFQTELPLVFEFLSIGDADQPAQRMSPEARSRHVFALIKDVLQLRCRRDPAVIIFEDLHWIDGASETFVERLVEAVRDTRALLLVNFRPEYTAPWLSAPHCRVLALNPLEPAATAEMLRDLLGADPSLRDLAERIHARTGGNPFFVEEVVQSLVETHRLEGSRGAYRLVGRPGGELAIPATVQAVLAARIDRLAEREKAVLTQAAVIGKEFSLPVLARVCEMSEVEVEAVVRRLVDGEFVFEQSFFPQTVYAFKHPLTQEVAYRSQLSERRAVVHAAVARAIAELEPEKADSQAGLIAHHWENAGELLEATRWTRQAAEWAELRNLTEAVRHWRKVRDLVERLPESHETMLLGLLARGGMIGLGIWQGDPDNQTPTLFAEGKVLAARLGDSRADALLEAAYSGALSSAGDVHGALEHSLEGVRLAELSGDEGVKLSLRAPLVYAYEIAGKLQDALEITERALANPPQDLKLGASSLGFSPYAFLVLFRGELLTNIGHLSDARAELERALALARELDEQEISSLAHGFFAYFARCYGDPEIARAHVPEALRIAERIGSALSCSFAYRGLASLHFMDGKWSEAAMTFEKTLEIARSSRTVLWAQPYTMADLAEAYWKLGRSSDAVDTATRALAEAKRLRSKGCENHAELTLARILLGTEGAAAADAAETLIDEAAAQMRLMGLRAYFPHVALAKAEVARLRGDAGARMAHLADAEQLFADIGAAGHLRSLRRELGVLERRLDAEAPA